MKSIIKIPLLLSAYLALAVNGQSKETDFVIHTDMETGGIQKIMNATDSYKMNWIFETDGSELDWFTHEFGWGLGFLTLEKGGKHETYKWNDVSDVQVKDGHTVFTYDFPDFQMEIARSFDEKGDLNESYHVKNKSVAPLKIVDMGIYTPFKDWYAGGAEICQTSRCNTHIWAGGHNASYVNAIRMGAEAPHLGLVLTKGSLVHYELINTAIMPRKVAGSNLRGGITLKVAPATIQPGGTYDLTWKLFWHEGYEDFYAKALDSGLVIAESDNYFLPVGDAAHLRFKSNKKWNDVRCEVDGQPISFTRSGTDITVSYAAKTSGDKIVTLYYDGKETVINLHFSIPTDVLLKKRVDFIIDRQQMKDPSDRRYGAYMVYDNETQEIYQNVPFVVDHDEGAERLGMGVAIANWLQQNPQDTAKYTQSLFTYYDFVRNKLQTPEYKVYSTVEQDKRHRGYNYPWVAAFYVELYKLTKEPKYILDGYHTMRKWYEEFGYDFYAICVPIKKSIDYLREAGFDKEANILLNDYKQVAKAYDKYGVHYPSHEVVYEQSIVSPAVNFYLEMYLLTEENKYLVEGKKHLALLEAFNGQQPDFHLNEIGIRHWDGFWFGKRQSFGDTMPHYWSALTGRAYVLYYAATGDKEYLRRGTICLENNLCNIRDDGTGACAYLYPQKINGKPAEYYDPWSNDQDWALFFYTELHELINWSCFEAK